MRFEPSAFIANIVAVLGVIVIAWKTAKAAKRNVDISFDAMEQQLDERAAGQPGAASRRTSVRPRQRFSTADAQTGLQQAEANVLHLLRVWVLFGLANTLASFGISYGIELRALVVVIGCLPWLETSNIVNWMFASVVEPLLGSVAPRAMKRVSKAVRGVLAAASPTARWATQHAYSADIIKAARTEDLVSAEQELARCVHATMDASARRLSNRMPRSSAPATVSDGDVLAVDRLIAVLPAPRSSQKERRARARMPLSPILDDEDDAPGAAAGHTRHASAPAVRSGLQW